MNRLTDTYLDAHVVLKSRLTSTRIRRIERLGERCFVHHFRIEHPDDLDDEVRSWLCRAKQEGS